MRILLADDNADHLELVKAILEPEARLVVVGTVGTGRAAVLEAGRLKPGVVVLDCDMPDGNGLDAARAIKAMADAPRVVMLTLHATPAHQAAASAAGADAFVSMTAMFSQLLPVILAQLRWQVSGPEAGHGSVPSAYRTTSSGIGDGPTQYTPARPRG
jgi:DNA-binding NarL/FixJ family response regulator